MLYQLTLLALPLASALTIPRDTLSKRSEVCGSIGYSVGTPAYYYQPDAAQATPSACRTACLSDDKCASFAVGSGVCMHFSVAVDGNLNPMASSSYAFYDRTCGDASAESCGLRGYDLNKPIAFASTDASESFSLAGCSKFCQSTSGCVSFVFSDKVCHAYDTVVAANFRADATSPNLFYDSGCATA